MFEFRSVCRRRLISVLLTLGLIFCVPVSGLAAGVITVTSPASGATVSVPFDVHFTYSATASYTKLWIDGVDIIAEHNGSTFDYTVTSLAAGSHTLALQADDASSNTVITLHVPFTVSSTPALQVSPSTATVVAGETQPFASTPSDNSSVVFGEPYESRLVQWQHLHCGSYHDRRHLERCWPRRPTAPEQPARRRFR